MHESPAGMEPSRGWRFPPSKGAGRRGGGVGWGLGGGEGGRGRGWGKGERVKKTEKEKKVLSFGPIERFVLLSLRQKRKEKKERRWYMFDDSRATSARHLREI